MYVCMVFEFVTVAFFNIIMFAKSKGSLEEFIFRLRITFKSNVFDLNYLEARMGDFWVFEWSLTEWFSLPVVSFALRAI